MIFACEAAVCAGRDSEDQIIADVQVYAADVSAATRCVGVRIAHRGMRDAYERHAPLDRVRVAAESNEQRLTGQSVRVLVRSLSLM